jgi:AcrR family transcriptional regulator
MPTGTDEADAIRRKTPKQDRAIFTAGAVIDAAQRVITNEGYKNATTNRIAEVAGVSVGSLYQYFPNKTSIAAALVERAVSSVAIGARECLRTMMDEPLLPALRCVEETVLQLCTEHKFALYELPNEAIELRMLTQQLTAERLTHTTSLEFFRQHASETNIANLDLTLHMINVATMENIKSFIMENPVGVTKDEFLDNMVRMVHGFLVR